MNSFVANDTLLVGGAGDDVEDQPSDERPNRGSSTNPGRIEGPSMIIMTGPNYSGKSVYLKQVFDPAPKQ